MSQPTTEVACKGLTQNDKPCLRKPKPGDGYCWQHIGQSLDSQTKTGPRVRKSQGLSIDLKIASYQEEIDELITGLGHLYDSMKEETCDPDTLLEYSANTQKIEQLRKKHQELLDQRKNNFAEEKQFKVRTIKVEKEKTPPVPLDPSSTPHFQRAIQFEIRKLNSRQKKLEKNKERNKKQ